MGIVTLLRAGRSGVQIHGGTRGVFFFRPSRPALELTQSPINWVTGFFPGVKAPGA